ncbi:MAG: Clp protease ClpP [Candidatus Pristimantibacillus lignocellulolyticus]|uniref:ATP-dependent Clp protease proteolytic subunit n=1 Tax=Candidatus Pristimantibacillus lignocellulolyticus TaxID=2994561 RepID=A0A9J6ZET3_9BACL|nr:MAG: Clp protease ClpP [Candidatus Pristimantibacillus lignocellulolyticus]
MTQGKKYWEFKAQSQTEADLYLYIQIESWGGGYQAHSAKSFKDELDYLGNIQTLNIYINSPGGNVFEGMAIHSMLKRHKAYKRVYIDGLAASISSVIAMAGDEIIMPSNAMMMIHGASADGGGTSVEHRQLADLLDKATGSFSQTYLEKAGDKLDAETLSTLLTTDTWLTAQEAYDYGLCTEIVGANQVAASISKELFAQYKNVPESLQAMLKNEPQEPIATGFTQEQRQAIIAQTNFELQNLTNDLKGVKNNV